MRDVVKNEIEQVLLARPGDRQHQLRLLRAAFIPELVTINPDNDQPMRRMARYDDLPPESRPLIDDLVAQRLMVKDTRSGHVVVEVALESLLRQWDDLARWLNEERQNLLNAEDLQRNANAWEKRGRDPDWLLPGTRLADAERLAEKREFAHRVAKTAEYFAASRGPKTGASHRCDAERRWCAARWRSRSSSPWSRVSLCSSGLGQRSPGGWCRRPSRCCKGGGPAVTCVRSNSCWRRTSLAQRQPARWQTACAIN